MTEARNLGDPPPEQRLFGLDRHLILPTLTIVAITLFMAFALPAIDASVPAIEFEPGAPQSVHDQIEFVPAPGWIADGVPAPSAPSLRIFRDGVVMTIAPGSWSGTADELLSSILQDYTEYHTQGDRRSFTLPSGIDGVALNLYGADTDGAVFGLVVPDSDVSPLDDRIIGVRLVVEGPSDVLPEFTAEIAAMVASMKPVEIGAAEVVE